jgi:hypothetical protein
MWYIFAEHNQGYIHTQCHCVRIDCQSTCVHHELACEPRITVQRSKTAATPLFTSLIGLTKPELWADGVACAQTSWHRRAKISANRFHSSTPRVRGHFCPDLTTGFGFGWMVKISISISDGTAGYPHLDSSVSCSACR